MAIAGNRYSVPNVDLSGLEGISKIGDRFRESNKREAFTKRAKEALESGSMEDIIGLNAEFPQLAPAVSKQMIGFNNDRTNQTFSEGFANVAQGLEQARMETEDGGVQFDPDMVEDYKMQLQQDIAEVEQRGGQPRYMQSVLQNLEEGDIEGAQREAQVGLLYANPKMYDSLYGSAGGSSGQPATVQEWRYYNKLQPEDQKRYLDMKRQGYKIQKINGVDTLVPTNVVAGAETGAVGEGGVGVGGQIPLTTLGEEEEATQRLAMAKEEGLQDVKSKWTEFNKLRDTEGGRTSGLKKAEYFYDKIASGDMSSGGMRKMLSYIPFTFTEQGAMDEEFNAFAETSARQALKESGEIRPTDADVKGMKQAMFGVGRDERVNLRLLTQFMDSIKRNDHKAYLAEQVTKYRDENPADNTGGTTGGFTIIENK